MRATKTIIGTTNRAFRDDAYLSHTRNPVEAICRSVPSASLPPASGVGFLETIEGRNGPKVRPHVGPFDFLAQVVWQITDVGLAVMSKSPIEKFYCLLLCFWAFLSSGFAQSESLALTNMAQVNAFIESGEMRQCKLRLEGIVIFIDQERGRVALQDDSGTAIIPIADVSRLHVGDKILVEGGSRIHGSNFGGALVENDGIHGIQERTNSIFLNAGMHSIQLAWFNCTGAYGLELFYQGPDIPLKRVQGTSLFHTEVNPSDGTTNWVGGLEYQAYEGTSWWKQLPDFTKLVPVKTGIAAWVRAGFITRATNAAVVFHGYIKVPKDGVYIFSVGSDDGSKLYIDTDPVLHVHLLATNAWPNPRLLAIKQRFPQSEEGCWAKIEGTVTFAAEKTDGLELELDSSKERMRVRVADFSDGSVPMLSKSRVQILGYAKTVHTLDSDWQIGWLLVENAKQIHLVEVPETLWSDSPVMTVSNVIAEFHGENPEAVVHVRGELHQSADGQCVLVDETGQLPVELAGQQLGKTNNQVEVLGRPSYSTNGLFLSFAFCRTVTNTNDVEALPTLTTVEQVKRLSYREAIRNYPVRIRGVVTDQVGHIGILQDASGAIHWDGSHLQILPRVGDYWEIKGTSYYALTPSINVLSSKIIGNGDFPDPVRPSWDQLNNGSLDTVFVEIQGIVVTSGNSMATLLTRGGGIQIYFPTEESISLANQVGALVRLRGCLVGRFDAKHQVIPGQIGLRSVSVDVDAPAPSDPFALPAKRISELRLFDLNASALQRVKVSGQIIGGRDRHYFLMGPTNGMRFDLQQSCNFKPGDCVDVVGFPDLTGPSPVLREAIARRTGQSPLKAARLLSENMLTQAGNDATRVQIESQVVAVRSNRVDTILELQVGPRRFLARMPFNSGPLPDIPLSSRVAVTGVYESQTVGRQDGGDSFELLLNSPADISVLERPSWWTAKHALTLAGFLGMVLLIASAWIRLLRRQVDQKTSQLRTEIEERKAIEADLLDKKNQLETEIEERKRVESEVEQIHKKLLDTSRQAGMAEVATNVLHNVGNVLNSVNVSTTFISEKLKQSRTNNFRRLAEMFHAHQSDLGDFLTRDPKGKQIPSYLDKLSDTVAEEQTILGNELSSLQEKVDHIKNIVAMQQNYAKVAGVNELVKASDLAEDALRMNIGAMERHQVQIRREYDPQAPQIIVDKHKVLQILINLLRNAKYACDESGRNDKQIIVRVSTADNYVRITVSDNGIGISAENFQQIFSQGFTTRKSGHGFGLHSGALAAKELGGSLTVQSEGVGKGASFTLELPLKNQKS